ncbi:hypothetical protein BKA65DRAFT_509470 [Rhexocercosporidium sp. MPI-PUGE-AT-0058]|nr:hypothetical protein BKA65DRAFT_509470 [Rhexocercosporidium sp. MPI-PUGE-AT-0058]
MSNSTMKMLNAVKAAQAVYETHSIWKLDRSNVFKVASNDSRIVFVHSIYGNSTRFKEVTRMNSTNVGSVPLMSFIYLLMSIVIVAVMFEQVSQWALGLHHSNATPYKSTLSSSNLTEKQFARQLKALYRHNEKGIWVSSETETVDKIGGTGSRDIRRCAELIRAKFGLDIDVYNLRDVTRANIPVKLEKERQSEGAMADLKTMVRGWVEKKANWSDEEWKIVEEIGERVARLRMRRDG